MKKAEEYINEFWSPDMDDDTTLINVIKQVQIDTIRETAQACADNAEADKTFIGNPYDLEDSSIEVYVIKSSILEVADKLIKELE